MRKINMMGLLCVISALVSCGGNDDDEKQSYNNFVKSLIANTSDTAAPASVNKRRFEYNNRDDAFDDTLAP